MIKFTVYLEIFKSIVYILADCRFLLTTEYLRNDLKRTSGGEGNGPRNSVLFFAGQILCTLITGGGQTLAAFCRRPMGFVHKWPL